MRDSAGGAPITAGGPEGLTEAYDKYADSLYKYCRFLLADPADAADAVQDTFVVAGTWTGGLGDEDRLRARLYDAARSQCLMARRDGKPAAAPDVTADGAGKTESGHDAGETEGADGAEGAGLRTLIENAAWGLDPAEREVLELHLRHGLEAAEIATVLGVSRHRARTLVARASDELQVCLGLLLAGRAGSAGCAELADMLVGWDGNVTPALRWWAGGHIKKCVACTARRADALSAAMPAGLSASAAMAAAAAESLRLADGPPAALKEHTLALAVGQDPSPVAYRAVLLSRAGSAGRGGLRWPPRESVGGPRAGGTPAVGTTRRLRTAAAACVMLAVVIAAVAAAMTNSATPVKLAGGVPPLPAPTAPVTSAPAPSATPAATPAQKKPVASRKPRRVKPRVSARATVAAAVTPTATAPGAGPTPAPPPPPPTQAPPPPPPTKAPPAPSLTVQPNGGQLHVTPFGAKITLTAHGDPVGWSVTASGGSGHVFIQPASGTLAAGHSITVIIFATRHASGRQLTVSPGGAVFTIKTGWGRYDGTASASRPLADSAAAVSPPTAPTLGLAWREGGCADAHEGQHRAGRSGTWRSGCRVRRHRHEPAVHRADGFQPV